MQLISASLKYMRIMYRSSYRKMILVVTKWLRRGRFVQPFRYYQDHGRDIGRGIRRETDRSGDESIEFAHCEQI